MSNNTLGSGVVTSSLTTVGTLDSGSISSNFGDIDIGANTIKSQDILVTNAGIGVVSASAALDIQDIFADKSSVNTIVKITSTTDDNTANIGFGGRISLNAENGGDASNSGSIQEAATIDYYLKERDVLDTDNTTSDLTADIWGLKFRIKDDEQMVDALTIVGAGGGPDGDNSQPHGANIGIGTNTPTNKLDVNGTFRATGAVTLDTTLDVTGATTLNSTLSITSATTINSTLSISGKYYGDGSELTSLSTNLISNDNSSVDILTKTVGNSISFDGVSTNSVYDERTSSGNIVSYSFRFKMTNATQTAYLFSSPTGTGGTTSNNRYVKIYNSGSSISLSNSNETTDGSGNINGDGSQYFQNDTWHHIVVSAQTPFSGPNNTDYKIYVDGVFKFTQSEDASLSSPYTSFKTKFKLGIGHFGTNEHFDGDMQEIYIFNSTISASQVSELYDSILPFNLNSNIVKELGASNSECIKFKNESAEIMRITDNKLGIGTTSPTEKLHVNGNIIANTVEANLTGNVTGNLTGDITGDVTGDVTGDLTGNVTGNLLGDVTGDITGDVTGDLTGNVTGNLLGDVTGNVTGDLIGDVTGNITGSLKGDVEEGEWKGKAIASTKLAVSEAIKTLSVIELNAEPGDEINENSDQALGTDATTTTADKAWREQTHNKLKRAEQNVESLRNTVDSLVLAMSQIIKAFE